MEIKQLQESYQNKRKYFAGIKPSQWQLGDTVMLHKWFDEVLIPYVDFLERLIIGQQQFGK